MVKQNKKKIYQKINKLNQKYHKKELDLKKANQSLLSWIGHANHITKKGLIKEVVNKCDWIYKEGSE